jgi:hypothetical protein
MHVAKIWFNLELGPGTMDHWRDLVSLKYMFTLADHISTTMNPWQEWQASNYRCFIIKFGPIWNGTYPPHASRREFDASKMHFQAGRTHIHPHKPLAGANKHRQNFV